MIDSQKSQVIEVPINSWNIKMLPLEQEISGINCPALGRLIVPRAINCQLNIIGKLKVVRYKPQATATLPDLETILFQQEVAQEYRHQFLQCLANFDFDGAYTVANMALGVVDSSVSPLFVGTILCLRNGCYAEGLIRYLKNRFINDFWKNDDLYERALEALNNC